MGDLAKWVSVFASLPLWLMLAVTGTAWLTLLLPDVGAVSLGQVRQGYGTWVALAAVFTSLASVLCAISKMMQRAGEARHHIQDTRRLDAQVKLAPLYEPLYGLLVDLPMCISTAAAAPRLLDRLENAVSTAEDHRPSLWTLRSTVRALSDRQVIGPSGEMEYGARFPIKQIEKLVQDHQAIADSRLIELTRRAVRNRFEEGLDDYTLRREDCELIDYITSRWTALRERTAVDG